MYDFRLSPYFVFALAEHKNEVQKIEKYRCGSPDLYNAYIPIRMISHASVAPPGEAGRRNRKRYSGRRSRPEPPLKSDCSREFGITSQDQLKNTLDVVILLLV
ncbi:MAG TPA: hypothetical protein VFU22_10805, partial [Roseiflexaceae bacterium]|nr:hypothetical protein [Roseiflexaceae bacterium]